jgi:hypothetical protein
MAGCSRGRAGSAEGSRARPRRLAHVGGLLAASVLLAPGLASGQALLEYGPFRLVPTLSLTGEYTDNVVLGPPGQEESDFITTIGVGLAVKLRGANYGGNLGGRVDILRYADNDDLDTTRYTVFADGRWELFRRLNLTLTGQFKRTDEFVGGPVPEFTELVEHNEATLELDAEYRVAERWSVGAGYRFYLLDYIDSTFDNLDYISHTMHVAVYYRIAPRTAVFGRYDYQLIRYDLASAEIRDSDSHFGWVGLRGDLTAKTSAEVRFGAQYQDFADGTSETDWVAHANVVWKYREPSQVRVFVERSSNQSTFFFPTPGGPVLDNTYIATYGGVEVAHRWTPRLAVKLFGLVGTNEYPDEVTVGNKTAERLDWTYSAGVGARYDFRRWLAFELGYVFRSRDSNFSQFDYTENRVLASILLTY